MVALITSDCDTRAAHTRLIRPPTVCECCVCVCVCVSVLCLCMLVRLELPSSAALGNRNALTARADGTMRSYGLLSNMMALITSDCA